MTRALCPVVARDLSFGYGRQSVLHRLSLQVDAGEIVAILGANGAGKSTLFSILAGLEIAHDGDLSFAGQVVSTIDEPLRAAMAYVAHAPQIYLRLSARENLEFFAALRRTRGAQQRPAAEVLQRLGLGHALDQPVSTYSRGMVQRVALARALAQVAELYLLDEPFTALDRPGVATVVEFLAEERARGAGILLASHDPSVIAEVADRVLCLANGRIVAEIRRSERVSQVFAQQVQALASSLGA